MKFLFLVLFLGVAQATLFKDYGVLKDKSTHGDIRVDIGYLNRRDVKIPVDKDLVKIQLGIVKLLNNINHLNTDKTVLDISKTYTLEDHIDRFVDKKVIYDLIRHNKVEGFLNRDKVFNILDDVHRHEVITITKVLIGAKDLVEFFKLACWLRNHVNGGVFTYALTVAVKNRDDCYGVVLPPLYEVQPMKFFKNKVIQKALQLKMQGGIFDEKYAKTLGVEKVDKNVYIIKTDYTGVNIDYKGEGKISYFTEDIGLNNNYYLAHVTTPFWIDYESIPTTRHNDYRRGELLLSMHENLLARYYLERLSNGLGEIPKFKWNLPIKTGYNPSLRHHNGLEYSVRPMNYIINTEDNVYDLKTIKDNERRIRDAIDRGYIWTEEGQIVTLRNPEDIDTLGNLIQSNPTSVNNRFYQGVYVALKLLGNKRGTDDNTAVTPSVLESFDTMLRDPVFYQFLKKVVIYNVHKFQNHLRPYSYDDLNFKGVKVNDVKVDKLVTYFDTYDVDITNVLNRDIREMTENKDEMTIKTRQVRLNHAPFNVDVDVTSDVTTECEVKIFLGPKYDSLNRKINCDKSRMNFVLLDKHITTLKHGQNTITRNSRQFNLFTDDMYTTKKLINKVENCLKGVEECYTKDVKHTVLIPDRLLLPKGKNGGMTFQLFVTVTPVKHVSDYDTTTKYSTKPFTPLRYPLDRKITHIKEFLSIDNFFLRDVVIYHKEGIVDKYTGEVKDFQIHESESSESDEKWGQKDTYYKNKNVYGNKYDSEESTYGKDIDSNGNILNKSYYYRKNNYYGNKVNHMNKVLGRNVYSDEDIVKTGYSLEDSNTDSSKEYLVKQLLKNKMLHGKEYSDEDVTDYDIKNKFLNKKGKFYNKHY